jgi:hypothetical protein
MKLNIKNTTPTSPSRISRGSNVLSIFIALATFFLVVGGVYLITKSISNKSQTQVALIENSQMTPEVKSASETRIPESNSLVLKDKSPESNIPTKTEAVQTNTTNTTPQQPKTATTPIQISSKNQTEPQINTPTENVQKPAVTSVTQENKISSTQTSKLDTNQSTIKIISQNGSKYRVQVIDTGAQNARYLIKDTTISLNLHGFVLNENKTYKITGITEKAEIINVNISGSEAVQEIVL